MFALNSNLPSMLCITCAGSLSFFLGQGLLLGALHAGDSIILLSCLSLHTDLVQTEVGRH